MTRHTCHRWRATDDDEPSICADCGKRYHNPCPHCGTHIGPFRYDSEDRVWCGTCDQELPEDMAADVIEVM